MGMEFLSRFPGLVVVSPLRPPVLRHGRSTRSMVDGLTRHSCVSVAASIICSPCCLSTLSISGINGCNRLEHSRSLASQTTLSASCAPVPYLRGRPRRLTALDWLGRFNNLIAALRCKPVTFVNSSSILPFSPLDALKYRLLNACEYSIMLLRVTFTSFRTSPSVTLILTQRHYLR
jgi:hypothetical protein